MNPLWGIFFKDRFRTPFSVYKMSLAEIVFLGAAIFGAGFGVMRGGRWLVETLSSNSNILSIG